MQEEMKFCQIGAISECRYFERSESKTLVPVSSNYAGSDDSIRAADTFSDL